MNNLGYSKEFLESLLLEALFEEGLVKGTLDTSSIKNISFTQKQIQNFKCVIDNIEIFFVESFMFENRHWCVFAFEDKSMIYYLKLEGWSFEWSGEFNFSESKIVQRKTYEVTKYE